MVNANRYRKRLGLPKRRGEVFYQRIVEWRRGRYRQAYVHTVRIPTFKGRVKTHARKHTTLKKRTRHLWVVKNRHSEREKRERGDPPHRLDARAALISLEAREGGGG